MKTPPSNEVGLHQMGELMAPIHKAFLAASDDPEALVRLGIGVLISTADAITKIIEACSGEPVSKEAVLVLAIGSIDDCVLKQIYIDKEKP